MCWSYSLKALEGEYAVFSELQCLASSGPNPAQQLLGKAVGAPSLGLHRREKDHSSARG